MTTALHFPPYVPYTLPEMADVPAPTAGDDGKALTYRHSLTDYVYTSFEAAGAVATHVGLANPHTQYLLASAFNPAAFDAAGAAAAAASGAATALATHAGVTSGVHGIAAFGAVLNATASQGAAQTALGLVIGTNVQAQNANLAAIAGLTTAANKVEYWTGSGAAALADFTSYGRGLVASANVAATGLLAADGSVTGATGQAQALTNGVITGKIYPSANGNNTFGLYRANGTTQDLYHNTTSGRIGIGGAPTSPFTFEVFGNSQFGVSGGYISVNEIRFQGFNFATFGGNPGNGAPYAGYNIVWNPTNSRIELPVAGSAIGWYTANDGLRFYAMPAGTAAGTVPPVRSRLETNGNWGFGLQGATALVDISVSSSTIASLRIRDVLTYGGALPTTPNDGDIAKSTGFSLYNVDSGTNAIASTIISDRQSSGTPAAGFGLGYAAKLHSSTTKSQDAGRLTWEWDVATHASRASRGKLSAYYTTTERVCIDWKANSTVGLIGFLGTAPVARPAAYTQTYSTAARTVAAYTTDAESAAYTGIDNAQAGTVYAQLADLNFLRVAYENLRASYDGLIQVVNSIIDDNQAYGLFA